MTNALNTIKRFASDEEGAALMEYTILLGILVVAVITIITTVGNWMHTQWQTVCLTVQKGGNCP